MKDLDEKKEHGRCCGYRANVHDALSDYETDIHHPMPNNRVSDHRNHHDREQGSILTEGR
jgi:hypothetical protein